MKKFLTFFLISGLMIVSFPSLSQTNKPYTDGALWEVSFIQIKPGMGVTYLKNLGDGWVKIMKQAKSDGVIMDYKVLSGDNSTKDDWNLMLMYQVKNYAALDELDNKMEAIRNKLIGNDDVQMKGAITRNDLREIFGVKLVQELNFK